MSDSAPYEPTQFQKFDTLMRRIIQVPKKEVQRREAEDKKRRARKQAA
jgi:hypothetical protein